MNGNVKKFLNSVAVTFYVLQAMPAQAHARALEAETSFETEMDASFSTPLKSLSQQEKGQNAVLSLDDQAEAFAKTQTGSYLSAMFPSLSPEAAVKAAIDQVVTKYPIQGFNYDQKDAEIQKLYERVSPLLQNEIERKDTDFIFYHGHSNELGLYIDVLKEFLEISGLKKLKHNHPLRLKDNQKLKNVDQFLDQFTDEYLKDAAARGVKPYAAYRNSGFTYAPDLTDFARQHLISVNVSLFGNTEQNYESTFYYFINSFNVGNPNEVLIKKLLVESGLAAGNEAGLQAQIDAYKEIFTQKMQQGGGGLMQIFVKKEVLDKLGYASWAKGIPYYMDKRTGKFATRNTDKRSLPLLRNETRNFVRPQLSQMMEEFKENAQNFSQKYSYQDNTLARADAFQARLFVNPHVFADKSKVEIVRIFKNKISAQDQQAYQTQLRTKIQEDFAQAIGGGKLTQKFFGYGFKLGEVVKYAFGQTTVSATKLWNAIEKSTTSTYNQVVSLLKSATVKAESVAESVLKRLQVLEVIGKVKEAVKPLGKAAKTMIGSTVRKLIRTFSA